VENLTPFFARQTKNVITPKQFATSVIATLRDPIQGPENFKQIHQECVTFLKEFKIPHRENLQRLILNFHNPPNTPVEDDAFFKGQSPNRKETTTGESDTH